MKSVIGYGLAAMIAYMVWIGISYFINEKFDKVQDKHRKPWVIAQWCTTGFLWYTWLSHDIANIAVFLPRELPVNLLIAIIVLLSVSGYQELNFVELYIQLFLLLKHSLVGVNQLPRDFPSHKSKKP